MTISKDRHFFILSFPIHRDDNEKNVSYLKFGLINRKLEKSDISLNRPWNLSLITSLCRDEYSYTST